MAGQGIQVSIQAKIEGWQEQIKQIQNAMKNIKPGTDISKGLTKDLEQVNKMVENLGKNMTQRLTSDSQITSFVDKMMDVERVFDRIGSSMQNISFGDIKPEYITANFQDLLSTIEKANNALDTQMQSSFQSAITGSKELQNEFAKMKLDPKNMNIDQVREALTGRGQELAKDLQTAQKEASKLKTEMQTAIATRDALTSRSKEIGKTDSLSLFGEALPTNGTVWDERAIEEKITTIREKLISLGATKTDLKILPDIQDLMHEAKWDQIPQELSKALSKVKVNTDTDLAFAKNAAQQAIHNWQVQNGKVSYAERLSNENVAAQDALNTYISQAIEQATAPLRQEIAQLKAQLEGKVTENVRTTGGATKQSSAEGMQEAAAAAKNYSAALEQVKAGEAMLGKIQGVVQRWFSIYAVVRMVSNAIKNAGQTVQELDSTMTQIAIVTKMSQNDLWAQMPKYTKMARDYASSIKGVYEVSQIYYQQGLEMNDVMSLTESTLKMARISGLDYSEAADYMTNAVRSFKMEMTDANRVVDVYSAVAASSASNVTELATAMSKTASSAASVGSSFENTTAMLAVMIEATRESPENIGSAMKSIISRYGELKENKTGIDEEGEEYSLNKVDKALQAVGISIHDANGEFRDFDDVILELSEHWNEIDKNTQRYIATVMAGNRQQSRFLALVSSSDRLKEERDKAANSEDASQLQFLKTLDSIDAKKQQLETSIQSIYTNSGIENLYKGLLDFSNNVLTSFDNLSSDQGLAAAVAKIGATFMTLATLVTHAFTLVKQRLAMSNAELTAQMKADAAAQQLGFENAAQARIALDEETKAKLKASEQEYSEFEKAESERRQAQQLKEQNTKRGLKMGGAMIASTAGLAMTTAAASMDINTQRTEKALLTGFGGILSGIGTGAMIGGIPGAIMGMLTALPSVFEAIGMATESTQEKIDRLQSNIDKTNNDKIKAKDDLKTLSDYKNKYEELSKTQHESAEKQKEFKDLQNEIAEKYPSLISSMDAEGNYIVDMADAYTQLAEAKQMVYSESFAKNLGAELEGLNDIDYVLKSIYGIAPNKSQSFIGLDLDNYDKLSQYFVKSFNEADKYAGKIIPREQYTTSQGQLSYRYDTGYASLNAETKERMFFNDNMTNAGLLIRDKSDSYLNQLLAGVYNSYIQEAMKGTAYENVNIDTDAIFNAVQGQYSSNRAEIISNPEKYKRAIEYAAKNFSTEDYKLMMTTYKADKFSTELRQNAIQSSNADYIKTLNDTVENVLDVPANKLSQYAIKKKLDIGLDQYLSENQKKIGKEEYIDENNIKRKYTNEKLIEEFYSDKNAQWYQESVEQYSFLNTDEMEDIYTNLGKNTRQSITEKLSQDLDNSGKQTYEQLQQWLSSNENVEKLKNGDISSFLKEQNIDEANTENIQQMAESLLVLQEAFDEYYGKIVERYQGWAQSDLAKQISDSDARETIAGFSELFGPEYLQGIQDQYKSILKNASLSEGQKTEQITALNELFSLIPDLDADIQPAVLNKIQTADLTSINGIYNLLDALADTDLDLEDDGADLKAALLSISQKLKVNVGGEINSYFNSIEEAATGFDKALSSAISGMDLKSAREMADKLGVELNDFEVREGKFFFNDIDKIKETYIKDETVRAQALKDNLKERYEKIQDFDIIEGVNEGLDVYGSQILNGEEFTPADLKEIFTETQQKDFEEQTGLDYDEFISYYEEFYKQYGTEGGYTNLVEFILAQVDEDIANASERLSEWLTQTQALSELKNGKFNDFITTILKGTEFEGKDVGSEVLNAAMSGDFSELETSQPELYKIISSYIDSLISFFKESKTSVLDQIIGMMGTDESTSIKVTDANKGYLKQLAEKGLINGPKDNNWDKAGLMVTATLKDNATLWSEISKVYSNEKDRLEAFKTLHKNQYSKNKIAALQNITDDEITYDDFVDYLTTNRGWSAQQLFVEGRLESEMSAYGLAMTASGDYVVENWSNYIEQLTTDLNYLLQHGFTPSGKKATTTDINAARATVENAKRKQQSAIQDTSKDILDNYTDVSVEQQETLANALGKDLQTLSDLYYEGFDGKTHLDVPAFIQKIKTFSKETQAALEEPIVNIIDDYLDNIKDAASLTMSGTSSQSEIVDFRAKARELGVEVSKEAFEYIKDENEWMLDADVMHQFVEAQAQQLYETGYLTKEEINDYVDKNVSKALGEAIDLKEFLNDEQRTVTKREKLKKQLVNAGISKRGITYENEDVNSVMLQIQQEEGQRIPLSELKRKAQKEVNAAAKRNQQKREEAAEQLISDLEAGGVVAVEAMASIKKLTDEQLTSEDIESAYRSRISKLEQASEQLSYGIGSLISGDAVDILEKAGYTLQKLGDGNSAVILQVDDISKAYQKYYDGLKETNTATLEALNEAYAKVLETKDNRAEEQSAMDALGEAAGMTYSTLGAILSEAGMSLEENLKELESSGLIQSIGGNKLRITDFASFARRIGWSFDSEEYTSALKTYNDGLIEHNNNIKKSVQEEIKGLEDVKPGKWLNLTETEKAIKNSFKKQSKQITKEIKKNKNVPDEVLNTDYAQVFFNNFQESLAKFGAYLDDGILKIADDANILGILETLRDAALKAGEGDADEYADMMRNVINSYTDAATKGIEGGMSYVEASDLRKIASNLGIEGLDFNETAEGLQLTQQSAIDLYHTLSQTDKVLGKKLFESLSKTLEENNEKYKTTTSLLAHIADLEQQITSAQNAGNDNRVKQLKAELALAKQINAQRLISEEADWNFMNNNALPGSFTNALEYWQGWATASQTLNTAAQKQQIDPAALATMFQHVYEIAEATGTAVEFMGLSTDKMNMTELLDALGSIVEIDSTTGQAILSAENLRTLGIELGLGANGISDGLKTAVEDYAKMNAEQLQKIHDFYNNLADVQDALIAEGLDWNVFFDKTTGEFDYTTFKDKLSKQKKALKAFEDFTKTVSIGEKKLSDLLNSNQLDAQTSKTVMSIFKMMSSDDWDASTGYQTIMDHLASSGFQGSLDLGEMQFQVSGNHVLYKTKKGDKWTTPEGKEYTDVQSALHQMQAEDLADFANQFTTSQKEKQESLEQYNFPGSDFTIQVDGDHYKVVKGEDVVADNITTNEDLINTIFEETKKSADLKRKAALEYMTAEGFAEAQRRTKDQTYERQAKTNALGQITTNMRNKLQQAGYTTGNALRARAEELWDESGLSHEEAAAQFFIETGIDIDPDRAEESFDDIPWDDYVKQSQLTQAAADVAAGITEAFSNVDAGAKIADTISSGIKKATSDLQGEDKLTLPLELDPTQAQVAIDSLKEQVAAVTGTVTWEHKNTDPGIDNITRTVTWKHQDEGAPEGDFNLGEAQHSAKGTIGLAHAKSTLMGELGPELVVSGNRYFVAGQNGPEFVDLDTDAIVFNHLQTQSLLTKGTSNTRGRAITNERNAVAYAKGSIHGGPAHSSSRQAATDTSAGSSIWGKGFKTLKTKNSDKAADIKAFIKEFERWYNWLQEIARIEKDINYEEAKRSRINSEWAGNGKEYYNSLKSQLNLLKDQVAVQKDLLVNQEKYFAQQRKELNSDKNPYNAIYEFDENGQIKYKVGGFEEFENLFGTDKYGNPNYTPEEQYKYLTETLGIDKKYFEYDKSGNKIDTSKDGWQQTAMSALSEKMESDKEKMQTLHDDIQEAYKTLEDLQKAQNELLQEMRDNQMELEQKIYDTIVEIRERAIEELEDTKGAIQDSNEKFIQGLSDVLTKEQQMYENNESKRDLDKLRAQRDILMRSGGSAAEIANLNDQIADQEKSMYFDAQQEQIDAIQAASDKQIEKLEQEISIQNEILDYQKKYGLLWSEVTEIMNKSPEEIADYIFKNDSEYWNKSPVSSEKALNDLLFNSEKWTEFRDDAGFTVLETDVDEIKKKIVGETTEEKKNESKESTSSGTGEGGNSGGGGSSKKETSAKEKTDNESSKGTLKDEYKPMDDYIHLHEIVNRADDGSWAEWISSNYESHTFKNGKCTKCGYKQSENWNKEEAEEAENFAKESTEEPTSKESKEGKVVYRWNGNDYADFATAMAKQDAYMKIIASQLNNPQIPTEAKMQMRKAIEEMGGIEEIHYSTGGYDYITGPAILHGTPQEPEAIFNAEQTKILRDNILGHHSNSLVNLLKSYNEAYTGLSQSTYDSISDNSSSLSIEKAEVNLHIDQLANDYDARQAANTVMEEMLRIASKTKANNSVRR